MQTLSRRAELVGAACLPALWVCQSAETHAADPMAPKCIRWPMWAGHDRAGCVMTRAELATRYSKPKKLAYALRRLARYEGRAAA
jgi:hypothetical protein